MDQIIQNRDMTKLDEKSVELLRTLMSLISPTIEANVSVETFGRASNYSFDTKWKKASIAEASRSRA